MKDYRLKVTIKNNYLLTAMHRNGFWTAVDLSRASGVAQSTIGLYLRLKKSPRTRAGDWKADICRIAVYLKIGPSQLFPVQHLEIPLRSNTATFEADMTEIAEIVHSNASVPRLPDANLEAGDLRRAVLAAFGVLTRQEEAVLEYRFGFNGEPLTLRQTAERLDRSPERIRQVEAKALRKLRKKEPLRLQYSG